jgi:putative FmdB family regulatory protein
MPLFEYKCAECEAEFELLIRGDGSPVCPYCNSLKLFKKAVPSRVSVIFNGTGWGKKEGNGSVW